MRTYSGHQAILQQHVFLPQSPYLVMQPLQPEHLLLPLWDGELTYNLVLPNVQQT